MNSSWRLLWQNPALAILFAIPAAILVWAVWIGVTATINYAQFDGEDEVRSRTELKESVEFFKDLQVKSAYEYELLAYSTLKNERERAFTTAGYGLAAMILPVTVSAIGRSTKNAIRELGH